MSQSFNCHCPERQKPLAERRWVVTKYKYRTSAFDGYQIRISDFSEVLCKSCGCIGRTKAAFVKELKQAESDWYLTDPTSRVYTT